MSKKRNVTWRDTTDLIVYGHEGWLELTSSHGHEGGDFEVHLKWGHNMQVVWEWQYRSLEPRLSVRGTIKN
jgi:uncharacterized GH25 family protein